ncbi:piggyBac transposable element-derived protein 4 [Trichonephila inaurata madagascariensis]|uniref:PiggyBac transposable element-derived protein 4 n=1 Tax=Trichonephila inaurata madagascariensis TaxID=2747483 RepID=A0A8X6Y9Z7_9ARAC|nr:piggyBac transposable element-derived protein 4 [Trichonephila inaurata madagascariensis]
MHKPMNPKVRTSNSSYRPPPKLGLSLEACLSCLTIKVPKFSHWSSNSLGNVVIKKNAISRYRCKTLLPKLDFAQPEKPENANKQRYIDEAVSCLKQTFKQCRSESSYQFIDESKAKFKGRSSLKQYMPRCNL